MGSQCRSVIQAETSSSLLAAEYDGTRLANRTIDRQSPVTQRIETSLVKKTPPPRSTRPLIFNYFAHPKSVGAALNPKRVAGSHSSVPWGDVLQDVSRSAIQSTAPGGKAQTLRTLRMKKTPIYGGIWDWDISLSHWLPQTAALFFSLGPGLARLRTNVKMPKYAHTRAQTHTVASGINEQTAFLAILAIAIETQLLNAVKKKSKK
ncbi:hypothetical protein BJV74DRAFT_988396 [Russula compacta]|nr:hypothetical protein BJV74DRAFT_988396 [Russula compacta]